MRVKLLVPLTTCFSVLAAMSTPVGATAWDVSCGMTIATSIVLGHDLSCSGDQPAITVAADDVTVDLGGHRITVTGTQYAITLMNLYKRLTIKDGFIAGAGSDGGGSGVLLPNGTVGAALADMNLTNLRIGIAGGFETSNITITDSYFANDAFGILAKDGTDWGISQSGFQNNGTDFLASNVVHSIFTNNYSNGSRTGLDFFAPGDWTIADNTFANETFAGIWLNGNPSNDSTIRNNSFKRGLLGIKIGNGSLPGSSNGGGTFMRLAISDNSFEENHASGLLIGVRFGFYGGGVIANNTFMYNGYDPQGANSFDGGAVAEDGMTVDISSQQSGTTPDPVVIIGNLAVGNANLGINIVTGPVASSFDGGNNVARENGNLLQCLGVQCGS